MYPYGIIGNCQISCLVNKNGSIDWLCLPRPDDPPVFGKLLDPDGGHFSIWLIGLSKSRQQYIPNTNVLETYLQNDDGDEIKITDFCPRFEQYGRMYKPISLYRIVEVVKGSPSIKVHCRPINGWEKVECKAIRGNSHLRYEIRGDSLRLITNMPLTYLCSSSPFALKEKIYLGLTWSVGIEEDLVLLAENLLKQTIDHWNNWVKECSIPTLYQKETIRSALTLKLHFYEDTGAILAALTTGLPEEVGGTRNWDYRFCWLRDAYYVLTAFYNLGHFKEMEGFIKYFIGIAEGQEHSRDRLRPVYKLDQTLPLPETNVTNWKGFLDSKPVRFNNQAAEHIQNDVYGEMILTIAPIFLDERFLHLRSREHEKLLAHLTNLCIKSISKSDAGLWEIRNQSQEHSFTNLMCWAGLDRLIKIQKLGFLKNINMDLSLSTKHAQTALSSAIKDGVLRNGRQDHSLDSSLLQLPILRYPDKKLNEDTVNKILVDLKIGTDKDKNGFLYRYHRDDDFGKPKSAFVVCSFWLVQALAKLNRMEEASQIMLKTMQAGNDLGLFSEHYEPVKRLQLGNFPQAYSHVGLINSAFSISPSWNDFL